MSPHIFGIKSVSVTNTIPSIYSTTISTLVATTNNIVIFTIKICYECVIIFLGAHIQVCNRNHQIFQHLPPTLKISLVATTTTPPSLPPSPSLLTTSNATTTNTFAAPKGPSLHTMETNIYTGVPLPALPYVWEYM